LAIAINANVVGGVVRDRVGFIFLERFRKAALCFFQIVTKCPKASGFSMSRDLRDSQGPVV
jgi:hypothetical protein